MLRSGFVHLHTAVFLFGLAGLFGKWVMVPAVVIVLGRTLFATAVLAGVLVLRRSATRPTWRLAGNGLVLAIHWVTFFESIRVSTVAIGLLGFASFPLFVLILERALLGVPVTRRSAIVAALVTGGLVLLVPEWSLANTAVRGLGWGLVSGFTFALLAVWNRRTVVTTEPVAIAFWQNTVAAVCLAPFAVAFGSLPTLHDLALLALLGIVCTALAHTLFVSALATVSAHTASVVAALEPVYGISLAWLLQGETPAARTLAGGALILGAAVVATRERRAAGAPADAVVPPRRGG